MISNTYWGHRAGCDTELVFERSRCFYASILLPCSKRANISSPRMHTKRPFAFLIDQLLLLSKYKPSTPLNSSLTLPLSLFPLIPFPQLFYFYLFLLHQQQPVAKDVCSLTEQLLRHLYVSCCQKIPETSIF